jgi:alpha-L-fucosidase
MRPSGGIIDRRPHSSSQTGKVRFKSGNWFWHEWDHSVATNEQILGYLDVAGQMEVNLRLNTGPMANGRLRPEDDRVLKVCAG